MLLQQGLWSFFSLLHLALALAATTKFERPPSQLLQVSDFRPRLIKALESHGVDTTAHVIRGLLTTRQYVCPAGYGECNNPAGRCCPLDGSCCAGSGCCQYNYWCYATGCCPLQDFGCEQNSCCPLGSNCCKGGGCCDSGYYCTIVSGVVGCCRDGTVCGSVGGGCVSVGYSPCPNDNFCCPTGDICYRDSSNTPRCAVPGFSTDTYTYSYPAYSASDTYVISSTTSLPNALSNTYSYPAYSASDTYVIPSLTLPPNAMSSSANSTSSPRPSSSNIGAGTVSGAMPTAQFSTLILLPLAGLMLFFV